MRRVITVALNPLGFTFHPNVLVRGGLGDQMTVLSNEC